MNSFFVNQPVVNGNLVVVRIGFNPEAPASNDVIVVDATTAIKAVVEQLHGKVVLFNGAASLPVTMALTHAVVHVAKAIGGYDPKMAAYVIAVSHDPAYVVGQVVTV